MTEVKPKIKVLIVARWPLGGIRTYLRYILGTVKLDFDITLLAASTHEDEALNDDARQYGANLHIVQANSLLEFTRAVFSQLREGAFNIIISQGFISAFSAFFPNLMYRLPHVLTIHGIVEPRYFQGAAGGLKRFLLQEIIKRITVVYAVGEDILTHLNEQFPSLVKSGQQQIVIPNGVDTSQFASLAATGESLRSRVGLPDDIFLFGFFGRFMGQKGFDLIIEAVEYLEQSEEKQQEFAIISFGSGDYLSEYQSTIYRLGLDHVFHFLPFEPEVYRVFNQFDAILMPSRWEASPLQPMEVLCTGTPLVASNCIGLREVVRGTPAVTFDSEDCGALTGAMKTMFEDNRKKMFQEYAESARNRFDIKNSVEDFIRLINKTVTRN